MPSCARKGGNCFTGDSVLLQPNGCHIQVANVRAGTWLQTSAFSASRVRAVVVNEHYRGATVQVTLTLQLTPWHPVNFGHGWVYPYHLIAKGQARWVPYAPATVFNIVLEQGHAVIDPHGVAAATLSCVQAVPIPPLPSHMALSSLPEPVSTRAGGEEIHMTKEIRDSVNNPHYLGWVKL